jgi:hypothetical protein
MTIDMTNNRVQYGLLTEEEKAALHEHKRAGGDFEHYCDGVWFKSASSWLYSVVYRTVPLPKTQDVIAWDRLPEWVECVARDANFEVLAYQHEPVSESVCWGWHNGKRRRIDDFPGIVQIGTCDWKDSKQRRPRE